MSIVRIVIEKDPSNFVKAAKNRHVQLEHQPKSGICIGERRPASFSMPGLRVTPLAGYAGFVARGMACAEALTGVVIHAKCMYTLHPTISCCFPGDGRAPARRRPTYSGVGLAGQALILARGARCHR